MVGTAPFDGGVVIVAPGMGVGASVVAGAETQELQSLVAPAYVVVPSDEPLVVPQVVAQGVAQGV